MVGLDVQTDGIRFIQLKTIKHQFQVKQMAISPLPPGVFVEGKIKQWDILLEVLSELVLQQGIKNQSTIVSLPANLVRMQHIQVPTGLPVSHIEAEIYAQVGRDFPSMTDTLCIDFIETPHKTVGYSNIFFIVARQAYLGQYIHCVNAAGLRVKVVDIDIYAMMRAVSIVLTPMVYPNEAQALVYVMNNVASFIVFNHHDILFYQQWDTLIGLDFYAQLKSQIQIFFSTFAPIIIHRLAVCAAPHDLTWLTPAVSTSWDGEIYYPDPFATMKFNAIDPVLWDKNKADFMIACGLAMREVPTW